MCWCLLRPRTTNPFKALLVSFRHGSFLPWLHSALIPRRCPPCCAISSILSYPPDGLLFLLSPHDYLLRWAVCLLQPLPPPDILPASHRVLNALDDDVFSLAGTQYLPGAFGQVVLSPLQREHLGASGGGGGYGKGRKPCPSHQPAITRNPRLGCLPADSQLPPLFLGLTVCLPCLPLWGSQGRAFSPFKASFQTQFLSQLSCGPCRFFAFMAPLDSPRSRQGETM